MEHETITNEQLNTFRIWLRENEKSTATEEKYLRDCRTFLTFLAGRVLSKDAAIAYKIHLIDLGYKTASINSMLSSVNALLRHLGRADCTVKILKTQRKIYAPKERELTRAEYLRLLQAAEPDRRLWHLLQTMCATGIRVSEVRYFTTEAIRQGEVTVHCKNKTRTILVPGKLRKLLLRYCKDCGITVGPIFRTAMGKPLDRSNIWSMMKRLAKAAGVAAGKVFPHNLRKLFARTFYKARRDIATLADLLGHSSINTTRIYIMTTWNAHQTQLDRMNLLAEIE